MPEETKICFCDIPDCAKCLGINCKDKDCLVHTKANKKGWRLRWEKVNNRPFSHPENY